MDRVKLIHLTHMKDTYSNIAVKAMQNVRKLKFIGDAAIANLSKSGSQLLEVDGKICFSL